MESAGLGFFIDDNDGAVYFQHGGADEGFQALLIASRDEGYGLAVMANSDNGGAIAQEILRAVALEYGWEGILEPAVEAVDLSAAELSAYEGRYQLGLAEVASLKLEGDALVARVTLQPDPSRLFPLGNDVFLHEERGEKLGFQRDAGGEIVAIRLLDRPGDITIPRLPDGELLPVELLEAGRTDDALEALTAEDVAEAPANQLGYALLSTGRVEEAVAVFRWNAERHPTRANPWDSLADGLLAVGDTAAAESAYRRVLRAITLDSEADSASLADLEQRARAGLDELGGR
jgi:Flp pilus assembly protein TadD